ncbi:MAG: hypothetical protein O9332_16750 [Microcystis sp. LE19-10.1B]|uniref:hypothetical protein n=1 Tax=Microcystis sp. LE19-10.1B TaxID=3016428 RepID=UPI0022BE2871|nr:hypothetical protein [Microcystis sp. LE19-10.1B]MCZ8027008.1 hypothetical protein [Microcystis sp. LE19-10.1B]
MPIVFNLERTNQLSLLPDKDLADFCPLSEPYQVTKNLLYSLIKIFLISFNGDNIIIFSLGY